MTQCEECGFGDGVHEKDCWLNPRRLREHVPTLDPEFDPHWRDVPKA